MVDAEPSSAAVAGATSGNKAEYPCLIRATDGKDVKISTLVSVPTLLLTSHIPCIPVLEIAEPQAHAYILRISNRSNQQT
jgi:hypothetical protein